MSRARVIKAGRGREVARPGRLARLISAREQQLERWCAEREARAEALAEQLVEEAQRRGARRCQAELGEARREAAAILVEARRGAAALVEQSRGDLARLAVGIAEKILGAELAIAPGRVVEIVSQVLRAAGPSGRLLARVHPLDLPLLEARWEQLAVAAAEGTLELRADAGVSRGGCILETDRGVADGRVEVQLATLQAVLFAEEVDETGAEAGSQLDAADTDAGEGSEGIFADTVVGGLTAVATAVSAPLSEGEHE
jgi:flagellar assembly protein FliH